MFRVDHSCRDRMITTNTDALSGKPRVMHTNRLIRIIKGRLKGGILLSNEESITVSKSILEIDNNRMYISVSWTASGLALLSTAMDGVKSEPKENLVTGGGYLRMRSLFLCALFILAI